MKTQDLFDMFQVICHSKNSVESHYLPVSVDGEQGTMNPAEIADKLVSEGEITDNTIFAVQHEDGENWVALSLIDIEGGPALF